MGNKNGDTITVSQCNFREFLVKLLFRCTSCKNEDLKKNEPNLQFHLCSNTHQ